VLAIESQEEPKKQGQGTRFCLVSTLLKVTAAVNSAVHTTSSVYDAMKSSSFLIRVFFAKSYICISYVFRFEGSTGLQIAVRSERLGT
jgi:hypothetical protein